ncbi:MAG: phosphatidylserine/phosphatidylglycerophosphate/cardiolipin synthase family protein [Gracilibacteraceae bacterium]|nr:phosphatidylserine/phosphatidylglycerophosphate/cardiolipin synthase family protein [Gracilibacteraceae bacterium]
MSRNIRIIMLVLLVGLLGAGCGLLPVKEPAEIPVSDMSGDHILLDGAAIKEATVSLIKQAGDLILIEQFIFSDPELLTLLIEKAQAGVRIHILLDRWQSVNQPAIETLKNNNISVQYYPAEKGQYQRIRYMLADNAAALVYSSDWAAGDPPARGAAVRLEGASVAALARGFAADWQYTTTLSLQLPESAPLPDDHISFVTGVNLRQTVLSQIEKAEREILIESIQVSQDDALNALVAARQRGCVVRVLLNPDVVTTTPNSLRLLREAGVEVKLYQPAEADAAEEKIDYTFAVIDGRTVIFAASAWSHATFVINHEAALIIPSPDCAEKLQAVFAGDWLAAENPPE